MSPNGSAPRKMFSLPAAIAATAAGIVAMAGGAGFLAAQPGLGMRAVIAVGTLALALPSAAALALRPDWWPTDEEVKKALEPEAGVFRRFSEGAYGYRGDGHGQQGARS